MSLYLWVNLLAVFVPLMASFHPRLRFYTQWGAAFPAILCTAIPFIIWDIFFVSLGVWGFNHEYVLNFRVWDLPIEEILFFICIPYACLFTYFSFNLAGFSYLSEQGAGRVLYCLLAIAITGAIIYFDRHYTLWSCALAAIVLLTLLITRPLYLRRSIECYLVLLVPFFVVNGVLTGTGIPRPVVWYNDLENSTFRFGTIPVEDFMYGLALILINIIIYEWLAGRHKFRHE